MIGCIDKLMLINILCTPNLIASEIGQNYYINLPEYYYQQCKTLIERLESPTSVGELDHSLSELRFVKRKQREQPKQRAQPELRLFHLVTVSFFFLLCDKGKYTGEIMHIEGWMNDDGKDVGKMYMGTKNENPKTIFKFFLIFLHSPSFLTPPPHHPSSSLFPPYTYPISQAQSVKLNTK